MATVPEALQTALQHHQNGQLGVAEEIYHRILEVEPNNVDALHLLGVLAGQRADYRLAVEYIGRAIALDANKAAFHNNLGEAYRGLRAIPEAIACCQRALELQPNYAKAWHNLGMAFKDQGELDEAILCYRRAQELAPNSPESHSSLLYSLNFCANCDSETIGEEHRRWNRLFAAPFARSIEPHVNDGCPDRRLRIGYMSPDFRGHPVGRFLLPLLEAHNHGDFEIFAYSLVVLEDKITELCRAATDCWRTATSVSDGELAAAIRHDRIDVLVDLTMHMAGNRILVFARKPAPVQVTYLAYCGTTGLEAMDYRLTDPYLDPPGAGDFSYSEESIRLPETYWCYRPHPACPRPGPPPMRAAGRLTFGCLNNFSKVSQPALVTWCQVLRAVPRARLLLHAPLGNHRDRVRDVLAQHDVSPDRLAFADLLPIVKYLRGYQQIDVALDPFPYAGGATTCDALWMGVPVVSLAGKSAVGRSGLSILSNVGLPELVARDIDQYVRIATELAGNLPRLAELRATLRDRMRKSPLMDAPRFARNVEVAYRDMWRRWCQGAPGT